MTQNTLQKLLGGKYRDNDTGEYITVPANMVLVDTGIKDDIADIIFKLDIGKKFCVVSDTNTHAVLGKHIEKSLSANALPFTFENGVEPDMKAVNKVIAASKNADAIIAVGSGTINDTCKYASYLENKPYAVFGTAPSMNGYSSANASISVDGHKKTLKAHMPKGIFLDLDILAATPQRLIRSGLGDSLCRPTAQADWLLSHLLLGTKYRTTPFELLMEHESKLFTNSGALMRGDREIMRLLTETLLLSGFGMYISGGSYPASQGEHMIAHTWEVVYGNEPKTFHGEQIAATTLTMAKIQSEILQKDSFFIKNDQDFAEKIISFYGHEIGQSCIEEYNGKIFTQNKLDDINNNIAANLPDIKQQLEGVMLPYNALEKALKDAGVPMTAEDLEWDEDKYKAAISHAKYMRDRFTFLDLC